jgi:hypothetical protein
MLFVVALLLQRYVPPVPASLDVRVVLPPVQKVAAPVTVGALGIVGDNFKLTLEELADSQVVTVFTVTTV